MAQASEFLRGDHVMWTPPHHRPVGATVLTTGARWVQIMLDSRRHRRRAADPDRLVRA